MSGNTASDNENFGDLQNGEDSMLGDLFERVDELGSTDLDPESTEPSSGHLWVVPDLEEHMEKVRDRTSVVPAHAAEGEPVTAAPVATAAHAAHAVSETSTTAESSDLTTEPAHVVPAEGGAEDDVEESEPQHKASRQTGFLADVKPIYAESSEYAMSKLGVERNPELPDDVPFDRRNPRRRGSVDESGLPAAARRRHDDEPINERMPAAARVQRPVYSELPKKSKKKAEAQVEKKIDKTVETDLFADANGDDVPKIAGVDVTSKNNVETPKAGETGSSATSEFEIPAPTSGDDIVDLDGPEITEETSPVESGSFDFSDDNGVLSDPLDIQDIEVPQATGAKNENLKEHGVYFHESIAGAPWAQGIKAREEDIVDEESSLLGRFSQTQAIFATLVCSVLTVIAVRQAEFETFITSFIG